MILYLALYKFLSFHEWQDDVQGHALLGNAVAPDHQSDTFFKEAKAEIGKEIDRDRIERLRRSPAYGISIDGEGNFLSICIASLDPAFNWQGAREFFDYGYVGGHTAKHIVEHIKGIFTHHGTDINRVWCLAADGASVNGVLKRMEEDGTYLGENVAALLREAVGHAILVSHCCGHKWELCAKAAWKEQDYFKEMEKRARALHNHIFFGPKARQDLVFWSDVTDTEVVNALSQGKARWPSCLQPLKRIHENYVVLMAHLFGYFEYGQCTKATKGLLSWIFQFMLSWQFRVTLAGCVDLLSILWKTKNELETIDLGMLDVIAAISDAEYRIEDYCKKDSVLANNLADVKEDGTTHVEKLLWKMAQENALPGVSGSCVLRLSVGWV